MIFLILGGDFLDIRFGKVRMGLEIIRAERDEE